MPKIFSLAVTFFLLANSVSADQFRTVRSGKLIKTNAPAFTTQTLSAAATSANLSNGVVIITGINTGATAITNLSNVSAGQIVRIVGNGSTTSNATTIADSGNFKLAGAFTANANDTLTILVVSSGNYVELGRADN